MSANTILQIASLAQKRTPYVQTCVYMQTRNFGAGDEKIVKARMKSVTSIQKITKAMKMVAASKLRQDQIRLQNGLPFCRPVDDLMKRLPIETTKVDEKKLTLVCLSSDKGLCGGVNSAVAKLARNTINEEESNGFNVEVFGVGDKIRAALQRVFGDRFGAMLSETSKVPFNFGMASVIAERLIRENPAHMRLIHNHFKSAIAYDTLSLPILTLRQAAKLEKRELDSYEFEPKRMDMWADLHEFYYGCAILGGVLDNIASEQSARMAAMDNASKNAGEMLQSLTLAYNKARQAKITMELVEIISGANAL